MILTKLKFKDKEHLNLRCLVQVGPVVLLLSTLHKPRKSYKGDFVVI